MKKIILLLAGFSLLLSAQAYAVVITGENNEYALAISICNHQEGNKAQLQCLKNLENKKNEKENDDRWAGVILVVAVYCFVIVFFRKMFRMTVT